MRSATVRRTFAMEEVFEVSVVDESGDEDDEEDHRDEGAGEEAKGKTILLLRGEEARRMIMCIPNKMNRQRQEQGRHSEISDKKKSDGDGDGDGGGGESLKKMVGSDLQKDGGKGAAAAAAAAAAAPTVCHHCGWVTVAASSAAPKVDNADVMNSGEREEDRQEASEKGVEEEMEEEEAEADGESELVIDVVDDDDVDEGDSGGEAAFDKEGDAAASAVPAASPSREDAAPSASSNPTGPGGKEKAAAATESTTAQSSPSSSSAAAAAAAAAAQKSPGTPSSSSEVPAEGQKSSTVSQDSESGDGGANEDGVEGEALNRLASSLSAIAQQPPNPPKKRPRLLLPKWRTREGEKDGGEAMKGPLSAVSGTSSSPSSSSSSVFGVTNATLRAARAAKRGYDCTIDPDCTKRSRVTLETSSGPVDVRILPHKAEKGEDGRFRCPVSGCDHKPGSRVYVSNHFSRDHPDYRSWRDVFIKKDAPQFVVSDQADYGSDSGGGGGGGGDGGDGEDGNNNRNNESSANDSERDAGETEGATATSLSAEEAPDEGKEAAEDRPPILSPQLPPPPQQTVSITSATETSWAAANRTPLCAATVEGGGGDDDAPLEAPAQMAVAPSAFAVVPQRPAVPAANLVRPLLGQNFQQIVATSPQGMVQSQNVHVSLPSHQPVLVQNGMAPVQVCQVPPQSPPQQQVPMALVPLSHLAGQLVMQNGQVLSGSSQHQFQLQQPGEGAQRELRQQQAPSVVQKYKIIQVMVPKKIANQAQSLAQAAMQQVSRQQSPPGPAATIPAHAASGAAHQYQQQHQQQPFYQQAHPAISQQPLVQQNLVQPMSNAAQYPQPCGPGPQGQVVLHQVHTPISPDSASPSQQRSPVGPAVLRPIPLSYPQQQQDPSLQQSLQVTLQQAPSMQQFPVQLQQTHPVQLQHHQSPQLVPQGAAVLVPVYPVQ